MGYLVALAAFAIAGAALMRGQGGARTAGLIVGLAALLQVSLGILTVLAVSPLPLSLGHQAGAVLLWGSTLAAVRFAWR